MFVATRSAWAPAGWPGAWAPAGWPGAWAPAVTVYGTSWCAATHMVRRYLNRLGIPYEYHDLEADPRAAARLAWLMGGAVRHPAVAIGGRLLVEPTLAELDRALRWAAV